MGRFRNQWMARSILVAALSCAAVGGSATPAFADVEPNNVISQAEGPVAGGGPIEGTLSTPDDGDYYVFYAASQQQIHLTSTDLTNDPDDDCLSASFEDTDGASIASSYTTPIGTNRFFVHVSHYQRYGCTNPMSYRFEIGPGAAVVDGPPLDRTLSSTGEPNETPGQAIGPLAANVNYVGSHDTDNDQDWFYFYVPRGTHQLDISVTSPSSAACDGEVTLFGTASDQTSLAQASADPFRFRHITRTVTGPTQYYLRAGVDGYSNCLGARWQFRIETPDAVTASNATTTPTPRPTPGTSPSVTNYSTYLTLRRRGAKYSGRLTSSRSGCKVGRLVILRRAGSGTKRFGTTYSRGDGTFTIKRAFRLRGQVYAMAAGRASGSTICRNGRSPTIRG